MSAPVETKVVAATAVTVAASVAVALLNATAGDPSLLGSLPVWAQTLILVLVPPLLTFVAAYQAPHSPRTDTALPIRPPYQAD